MEFSKTFIFYFLIHFEKFAMHQIAKNYMYKHFSFISPLIYEIFEVLLYQMEALNNSC